MSASISFRPPLAEQAGLFVGLAGGTNSGKTFSALRLARGIAGPKGRIAAVDTEAGRMSHYAKDFAFDVFDMAPPFHPERFADAAKAAEEAGFGCLVIDSFSMEWVGPGGILDWQARDFERMGGQEKNRLASWIKPKMAHKAMVYSFLQRRIPIVFAMRAEEKAEKEGREITRRWAPICNKDFPFEITVSFMLSAERKGFIDLSMPHKMEGAHTAIFRDGEQLAEDHGARLIAWARGDGLGAAPEPEKPAPAAPVSVEAKVQAAVDRIRTMPALNPLHDWIGSEDRRRMMDWLRAKRPDLATVIETEETAAHARLNGAEAAA